MNELHLYLQSNDNLIGGLLYHIAVAAARETESLSCPLEYKELRKQWLELLQSLIQSKGA